MNTQRNRTVLAVDDDEINLTILVKNVQDAGYDVKAFTNADSAWAHLMSNPGEIDIALLDKMMPGTGGIELLRSIKNHHALKHIPVILQTGDVGVSAMREGLESGAYYYLTKPFHPEILTAILNAADHECTLREELLETVSQSHEKFLSLMQEGEFIFKTHTEAQLLANTLGQHAEQPELASRGLAELMYNAIEHGNLGVGYDMKSSCLMGKCWIQELMERSSQPEYRYRLVRVRAEKVMGALKITISDEGNGFDWQNQVKRIETDNLNKPNGRGIVIARNLLGNIEYSGKGNVVQCTIGTPLSLVDPEETARPLAAAGSAPSSYRA